MAVGRWAAARVRSRALERPAASMADTVRIEPVRAEQIRVVLEHDPPSGSGITGPMVWGAGPL